MGILYYNSDATNIAVYEVSLDTDVPYFEIKNIKEIPTMGGIKIFVGARTGDHSARIKVSNLNGRGIFADINKYASVYIDKGEFHIKDTGKNSSVKLKTKEKEQIKEFYLRNINNIDEHWAGIINDDELVRRIHETEMRYYEETHEFKVTYSTSKNGVKEIIDSLPMEEKKYIGSHVGSNFSSQFISHTKNLIYRNVLCLDKFPVSFIDVYMLEKGIGTIVMATRNDPRLRHKGYGRRLVLMMIDDIKKRGDINTLEWEYDDGNEISFMMALSLGFDGDGNKLYLNIAGLNEACNDSRTPKSGYYRVSYNGVGIYEALKQAVTKDEWIKILKDPKITWLPKPPEYANGYISYFTPYGYKMFETHTYTLISKYLNEKDILAVKLSDLGSDIIYQDKYQVVVNTSLNEACKDLATARKFVSDVDKLAKKYEANYFIVTDGASGTRNGIYGNKIPNDAVRNARNAQKEWEKKNGFDPDEDWVKESSNFPNTEYMENLSENTNSKILHDILEFNERLNQMEYILPNKGNIITQIKHDDYENKYYGLTPKEFEKYNGGVCWDYIVYEAQYFKKNFKNVQFKTFFIVLEDTDGDRPTHTILLFYLSNKIYWFESSWKPIRGVYEFKSESDALNCVVQQMIKQQMDDNHNTIIGHEIKQYNALDSKLIGLSCNEYYEYMDALSSYNIRFTNTKIQLPKNISSVKPLPIGESSATDDKEYGLPELKKYPMPDEKHVLSAIRFFNYVSPANEEEPAQDMDSVSYRNKYLVMKKPSLIKCTVARV